MGTGPTPLSGFRHLRRANQLARTDANLLARTAYSCGSWLETEREGFEPSIDEKTPITVFETATSHGKRLLSRKLADSSNPLTAKTSAKPLAPNFSTAAPNATCGHGEAGSPQSETASPMFSR